MLLSGRYRSKYIRHGTIRWYLLNKLVLENLKHRPVRTFLSVLAIGVEVTMMLTLVGLSHGMLDESARRARGVGADIVVRPPGSSVISLSSAPMSDKFIQFFEKQPHVSLAVGTMVHPIGGINTITGIDLDRFNRISGGFRYQSGGPFDGPDDIIVDEFYATQNNLKAGSMHELLNRQWRVAGVVEPGKLARIFVQLPVLQELTGNTGKLSQIYLKVDDPALDDEVVRQLRSIPALKDYYIYTLEEFTSLISVTNVPGLRAFIYVIIGLSVVVGFIVVFMAMYTAVLERTREIGVLKALGASSGYILNLLVRETVLLALLGSVLGILMTFGSRWLIETLVPASLTIRLCRPGWPSRQASLLWERCWERCTPGGKLPDRIRSRPLRMNSPCIIEVRDLRKTYRAGEVDVHALRGVNLDVSQGEFISIVGPSGSGKSTLFNVVGGLTPPTSGTVKIGGKDLAGLSDADRTNLRKTMVGFVFQKYNLLPTLSARDNIEIARHIAGRNSNTDTRFQQVLELLGIGHRLHHKPRAMSGGEQQRVAIARAIVNDPAILLADEPTGNLDTENSAIVLDLLRDLNERMGQTILMITHNPEAAAYGHRTVHMRDGSIVDAQLTLE